MEADEAVSVEMTGDTAVIRLTEDIDHAELLAVSDAFEEVFGRARRVVVDLARARYLDSTAIGLLLMHSDEVRARGGDVKICNVSPRLKEVFDILGFSDLLDIRRDSQQAVEARPEGPEPSSDAQGKST